jgi:chemotaxis protein histidine kinase CheA
MIVRGCLAGLLLSLVLTGVALAQEPAAVKKVVAADAAGMAAYKSGDAQRAKDTLLEAIVLGKENGLEAHPVMASVYLHLGAVQADGLKDEVKAKRYFNLAVRLQPDIEATGPLATPAVQRGLAVARQAQEAAAAAAAPAASAEAAAPAAASPETAASQERARQAESQAAEARKREKATEAALREKEREAQEKDQKAREERDRMGKDLAAVQGREKQEREAKEKLEQLKADLEQNKGDLEKQLAALKDREKQEREAKEKLQKEKQDLEKQLAEARDAEKKAREARDQLVAEVRGKQERSDQEKQARDKLAEGPDMPASIPEPIYCPTRDEWASGVDGFVHCAPQSELKAKELALYYRPSGAVHYNSLLMDRTKKGWYVGTIPGARVTGRLLQYYVEARGAKGDVAASNGKSNSPNVVMVRSRVTADTPTAAPTTAATPAPKLTSARATEKSRAGRRKRR